ncbi:uncharacterized protein LOC130718971 [Lotus japonicus]|uniref:uncharacterized protein LOC130718971 n=1 Tax=Lotus japonicus TaxID=34305 RepID=UPI00258DF4BE|nr:uncharacterized protein LOC130718971 [Lotus japonicus]
MSLKLTFCWLFCLLLIQASISEAEFWKMKRRSDYDLQAKTSAEFLQLYKVKLEGANNLKKMKGSSQIQQQKKNQSQQSEDQRKNHVSFRKSVQVEESSSIQQKIQQQRQQPVNSTKSNQEDHSDEQVPEAHFRELIDYWRLEAIKEISAKNARNIAQQKWRHRVGPISFACIRERLRASKEDGESSTQADIFIETRKSKKGKKVDEETNNVITKLHDLVENCGQSSSEAFKQVFGDERPGRVRCYGRTMTPSVFKRNNEIAEIEKKHAKEVQRLTDKVHDMEAKHEDMERKFQILLRTMLNHTDNAVDLDALAALLLPSDDNGPLHSSTFMHAPNNQEQNDGGMMAEEDDATL